MARKYAGILALVGMTVVLLRATKNGTAVDSAILSAIAWMTVLGLAGLVIGAIAQSTVDQAVLQQIETDLAALETNKP